MKKKAFAVYIEVITNCGMSSQHLSSGRGVGGDCNKLGHY